MQKKVTILDYGLGNIFSVSRTFSAFGCQVNIAQSAQQILEADFLVLPGVGAFKKGMDELTSRQFIPPILEFAKSGKPLLGICLGMQLLFEYSEENGTTAGLNLLPGKVVRIVPKDAGVKVPHIGWSRLNINPEHAHALTYPDLQDQYAYFVHSYHPMARHEHLLATTNYYGHEINAMVMHKNMLGCQFHPEKSGENFMPFLKQITAVDTPTYA